METRETQPPPPASTYIKNEGHDTNENLIKYLDDKGAKYSFTHHEIDFSQPLQKREIHDFIDTYYASKSTYEKNLMMDDIICEDDHCIYKNNKQISIFVIEKFN